MSTNCLDIISPETGSLCRAAFDPSTSLGLGVWDWASEDMWGASERNLSGVLQPAALKYPSSIKVDSILRSASSRD